MKSVNALRLTGIFGRRGEQFFLKKVTATGELDVPLWIGHRCAAQVAPRLREARPGDKLEISGRVIFPQQTRRQFKRSWLQEILRLAIDQKKLAAAEELRTVTDSKLVKADLFEVVVLVDGVQPAGDRLENLVLLACQPNSFNAGRRLNPPGLPGVVAVPLHQTIAFDEHHAVKQQWFRAYASDDGLLKALQPAKSKGPQFHLIEGELVAWTYRYHEVSEEATNLVLAKRPLGDPEYRRLRDLCKKEEIELPGAALLIRRQQPLSAGRREIQFDLPEVKFPRPVRTELGLEWAKGDRIEYVQPLPAAGADAEAWP